MTEAEYEEMKNHAEYGYKILAGGSSKLLELAATYKKQTPAKKGTGRRAALVRAKLAMSDADFRTQMPGSRQTRPRGQTELHLPLGWLKFATI